MSREIKFRGLPINSNEWVYGSLVNNLWTYSQHSEYKDKRSVCEIITGKYNGDSWEDIISDTDSIVTVEPDSVGQFTGLKDRLGNDIYEADICRGFQKEQEDKEGVNGYWLNDTVTYRHGGFQLFSKNLQDAYTKEQNVIDRFMWHDSYHAYNRSRYYQINDIEVIGNIHQNPELL